MQGKNSGDNTLSLPALKVGGRRSRNESTAVTFSDHVNSVRNKRVTYEDFEAVDSSSLDRIKTSKRMKDEPIVPLTYA